MPETLPENTALLIIDVQQGLFAAAPPPFEAEAVVARINAIAARARHAGVPILFVQQDGTAEDNLQPFSPGWQLHRDLRVAPAEPRIRKTTCDAFYETDLEARLRSLGVTSLLLTGYATDFCIDTTLRNAVSRGFAVTVAADAHTTNDNPVLKAELIRAHYNWAWPNCLSPVPVQVLNTADLQF